MKSKEVSKIIESVIEKTEKRLYDDKLKENPSLDYKKFIKKLRKFDDKKIMEEASAIYDEEIDKAIANIEKEDIKLILTSAKSFIWINYIDASQKSFLKRHKDTLLILPKMIIYYLISISLFLLFYDSLNISPIYALYLGGVTSIATFILGQIYNSFILFMYDNYFHLKMLIIIIVIFMGINYTFYPVFNESIIWPIYFIILEYSSRFIEKRLFR